MKLYILIGVLFLAVLLPAQTNKGFDISRFYYLEGNWIINEKDAVIHEQWKKENDSLLTCISFYVKDGDTTGTEKVRLEKIGNDIFYIPVVEHYSGAVMFRLVSFKGNKAEFENPEHDFPQKIIYERINNTSLNARIEGMDKGKFKAIDYPFKRAK